MDRQLVIGSLIFGIGWGLAGFCPGPAVANLAAWRIEALVFVPAMAVGMLAARWRFAWTAEGKLSAEGEKPVEAGEGVMAETFDKARLIPDWLTRRTAGRLATRCGGYRQLRRRM